MYSVYGICFSELHLLIFFGKADGNANRMFRCLRKTMDNLKLDCERI